MTTMITATTPQPPLSSPPIPITVTRTSSTVFISSDILVILSSLRFPPSILFPSTLSSHSCFPPSHVSVCRRGVQVLFRQTCYYISFQGNAISGQISWSRFLQSLPFLFWCSLRFRCRSCGVDVSIGFGHTTVN